jgi:asparagine synthase (glutamine-hydrolysing)
MKIIGVLGKSSSVNNIPFNFANNERWTNINITSSDISLKIYYDTGSPALVINNMTKISLCDDKLYALENKIPKKLTADETANMLEKEGILCINKIISDFNLFLYDKTNGSLYIASNRATAGRMFYVFWKDTILFSNDFTLLLNVKPLNISTCALYAYTKYNAIPEDITPDTDIKSVPVGHFATIEHGSKQVKYTPFYKFNYDNNPDSSKAPEELLSYVERELKANAKAISDKQIHMLMSGGIDSSLFVSYLREYTSNIIGHYCYFGGEDAELPYAELLAKKLNIPFKIHPLDDKNIIPEIEDTALNTSYPHGDYSNVSVNLLIREVKEEFGTGQLVIDCNGGDDGFGYGALNNIGIWEKLYKIPAIGLLGKLATIGDSWMYDCDTTKALFYPYRAKEKNIYLSHVVYTASEKVFKNGSQYNKEIEKLITEFLDNNNESKSPSSYSKMSVVQFYHVNSRLWTAKGYWPAEYLNMNLVFPYTWKNILDEQCKLPLDVKVHNGIIKWPLKKLLEKYMPKDYIYRAKSGFAPPLCRWLKVDANYDYFYKTVMNGVLIRNFDADKIDKIFKLIKANKNVSRYAMNLIWSLLFFEVWLVKHRLAK